MKNTPFLEKVSLAFDALNTDFIQECIDLLAEAFSPQYLPDDLTADNFNAFFDALEIVEVITENQEVRQTAFVRNTLANLRQAMELLLEGETDYLDWNLLQEFYHLLLGLQKGVQLLQQQYKKLSLDDSALQFAIDIQADSQKPNSLSVNVYGRMPEESRISSLTAEKLAQIKQAFETAFAQEHLSHEQVNELLDTATELCLQGEHETSIAFLDKLNNRFEHTKARCLNLIGANHFYLQNYEIALSYYAQSLKAGQSPENAEFNIAEACQKLVAQAPTEEAAKQWRNYFKALFPNSQQVF